MSNMPKIDSAEASITIITLDFGATYHLSGLQAITAQIFENLLEAEHFLPLLYREVEQLGAMLVCHRLSSSAGEREEGRMLLGNPAPADLPTVTEQQGQKRRIQIACIQSYPQEQTRRSQLECCCWQSLFCS